MENKEILKSLTTKELTESLGLTIKRDETNKLLTFLACLSAYTEDSQLNISFNAPSSSGKSFIPIEIAKLFPEEDVIQVAYCSPTAFFHDVGVFNKEKGGYIVDLSRKILIFLDQPHTQLLQHLRPLLSHDKKEIRLKITDKSQKAGLRTKNIFLIGYPVVIFCTAGLKLDEQEATRFLLLSPEIHQEKLREAISEKIYKESNKYSYFVLKENDPKRVFLRERILKIKEFDINDINIGHSKIVREMFFERTKFLKPRHQRDIGRIMNLVKVFALLNAWNRKTIEGNLYSNEEDVKEAFVLWDEISESQELNLPPFVYNLYKDIILTAYKSKNGDLDGIVKLGLTRQDIHQKHFEIYGRFIPDWMLRQQILPMLESSGLITQEPDDKDKRKMLVYPTMLLTTSDSENNSELSGGVNGQSETTVLEEHFVEKADTYGD